MAEISKHAKYRIKERIGISKTLSTKLADKALEFGKHPNEFTGSFRRYLDKIYFTNRAINNIRVYNNYIYLFQNSILVTVLLVPYKYRKNFKLKSKIDNSIKLSPKWNRVPIFSKTKEQIEIISKTYENGKEQYWVNMNSGRNLVNKKDIYYKYLKDIPIERRLLSFMHKTERQEYLLNLNEKVLTYTLADKFKNLNIAI
jgi:hypothetical protein